MESKTKNHGYGHRSNWCKAGKRYGFTRHTQRSSNTIGSNATQREMERVAAKLSKPENSKAKKAKILKHRSPTPPATIRHADRKKENQRLACRDKKIQSIVFGVTVLFTKLGVQQFILLCRLQSLPCSFRAINFHSFAEKEPSGFFL